MSEFIDNIFKNKTENHVKMQILFLDIVAYSKRNTARQFELIQSFQKIVRDALHEIQGQNLEPFKKRNFDMQTDTILLPTGDGLAIGIPYHEITELALELALAILQKVSRHNSRPACKSFKNDHWCNCHNKFTLRCGIHSGNIVLYRDLFSDRFNLAGSVINLASRIMNAAGPNQIFLHPHIYAEIIDAKISFPKDHFHEYDKIIIKHGESIAAYQYIKPRSPGLNTDINQEKNSSILNDAKPAQPTPQARPRTKPAPNRNRQPPNIAALEQRMVHVPKASFIMGIGSQKQSQVYLTRPFAIDPYLVTQEFYQEITGTNPSCFTGTRLLPVDSVSWMDAVQFCNKLSAIAGYTPVYQFDGNNFISDIKQNGFRLPTEAEWEYCCWGCSKGVIPPQATDAIAWFMRNSQQTTHPVGTKEPNPCGLYDMLGNLWEWCHDWFAPDLATSPANDPSGPPDGLERVLRGGSWIDIEKVLTPIYRNRTTPRTGKKTFGFRIVRTLDHDNT
ncbi:MAG: SUMF1/EgtB/PvdO family nonheme iron enzyme [Magnetococcales bacterium]|nr:SUMF1/EgtB/PvdO family nonheme iron enzyme [Magnetococcales bacterium]